MNFISAHLYYSYQNGRFMRHSFLLFFSLSIVTLNLAQNSFYDFKLQKLNSEEMLDFSDFKGKKVLLVNVASKCGFTYQYEDLEKLYNQYSDNLVVVGLPCNQFFRQEPGSEKQIAIFCNSNYDISFPMTTKIDVKGSDQHPLYKWLTQKALNGVGDYHVSWNFNKFLIDEYGQLIAYFPSKVKPLDDAITVHLK